MKRAVCFSLSLFQGMPTKSATKGLPSLGESTGSRPASACRSFTRRLNLNPLQNVPNEPVSVVSDFLWQVLCALVNFDFTTCFSLSQGIIIFVNASTYWLSMKRRLVREMISSALAMACQKMLMTHQSQFLHAPHISPCLLRCSQFTERPPATQAVILVESLRRSFEPGESPASDKRKRWQSTQHLCWEQILVAQKVAKAGSAY